MARIEAVVLDIGNVLIGWQPEAFYDSEIGEQRRLELFGEVDLESMNQRVDLGEDLRQVAYGFAERNPRWAAEIRMWHDRWIDMITPEIEKSVMLMRALRARGVPVFSLTNFGDGTYDVAALRYPFLREFDRDFISGRLGMIKPDPRIYEHVERESSVAPHALLFTDDKPENIAAARQRGWNVHLFDGPDPWARRLVEEGLLSEEDLPGQRRN